MSVAHARPVLEELVRQAVDRELDAALERLAAATGYRG
jgi:hypothetical protein